MDDTPVIYRHKKDKETKPTIKKNEPKETPLIYKNKPQKRQDSAPQKPAPSRRKMPMETEDGRTYNFRLTKEAILIKTNLGDIALGEVELMGFKWAAGYVKNGKIAYFSEETVDYCVLVKKKGLSRLATATIHVGAGHLAGVAITAIANKDGFDLGKTYYVEIYLKNGKNLSIKCSDTYFKMLKKYCKITKEKKASNSISKGGTQYCSNCGTKIEKTANYCRHCGSKVS